MKIKFSTLVLASAALAAAALTTIPAMAATTTTLNVPFSFTVNGHSLPAGQYSVQRDTSGNFLRLQGKDGSENFLWVAAATSGDTGRVILRFDEQGQTHALHSVQYGPAVTTRLDRKTRKHEGVAPQYMPGQ